MHVDHRLFLRLEIRLRLDVYVDVLSLLKRIMVKVGAGEDSIVEVLPWMAAWGLDLNLNGHLKRFWSACLAGKVIYVVDVS